jgi:class 3 adenylate cyclase
MVAFADPNPALQFSLAIQREMLTAPWPASLFMEKDCECVRFGEKDSLLWSGLRVRVGIHTGRDAVAEMDERTFRVFLFLFVFSINF